MPGVDAQLPLDASMEVIVKRTLIALFAVLLLLPSLAPRAHAIGVFGLKGGVSLSHVNADLFDTDNRTGFVGGAYAAFELSPNLAFQPELLYVRKGARLFSTDVTVGGITFGRVGSTLDVDYVEVPLLLRVSTPSTGPVDLRLLAGPVVALKANEQVSFDGLFGVSLPTDEVKSSDFGLAVGGAVAVRNGGMNVVGEGRYTFGLTNISDIPFGGDVKNGAFYATVGLEFPF
jgi:hypothetical protein